MSRGIKRAAPPDENTDVLSRAAPSEACCEPTISEPSPRELLGTASSGVLAGPASGDGAAAASSEQEPPRALPSNAASSVELLTVAPVRATEVAVVRA